MKSLKINLLLATAAWLVASGVASAAEMRFDIPFAFQVGDKVMAAGSYNVRSSANETFFRVLNVKSAEGASLLSQSEQDPRKEWRSAHGAVMQFACGNSGCVLTQIWTHQGYPAHKFNTPKTQEAGSHVALIRAATGQ